MALRRAITKVLLRNNGHRSSVVASLLTESVSCSNKGLGCLSRSLNGSYRCSKSGAINRMSTLANDTIYTSNDTNEYPVGMNQSTRELAKDLLLRPANDYNDATRQQSIDPTAQDETLFWRHRVALSKTITLVESSNPEQHDQAALLLSYLLQQPSQQPDAFFRVGIAGPPGAGKSTLIEALGRYILDLGNPKNGDTDNNSNDEIWKPGTLSVICIDPSSVTTGGSIMGDKTRMMELSRDHRAFVRPAPTKGAWGGLAPTTDDVIRIVAASESYPLILLETVGLGQSELEVQQCVDMLLLAVPPGGGDSLQGVKKGIVEIADTIVVTKADGALLTTARHTAADYRGAMQFLNVVTTDEYRGNNDSSEQQQHRVATPILLVSSVTGDGLPKLWKQISDYRQQLLKNGVLHTKRQQQNRYWMWRNLRALVQQQLNDDPVIQQLATTVVSELDAGRIPPRVAASLLLENLNKN